MNIVNANLRIFIISALFGLLSNFQTITAQLDFKTGQIIDTVSCIEYSGFSYALYLPSNYSEEKKWPIVFIFDPGARGILGVRVFRDAAEKYGYILACSNNSRNGPMDNNIKAAHHTIDDVTKRFSIEPNRIYTSGFSGGSRVAQYVAENTNMVSGVIGCMAGKSTTNINTTDIPKYDYIGLIGRKDINFLEMIFLEEEWSKLGANIQLRFSDLKHEYPTIQSITEAVEWMELNAINRGLLSKNDSCKHAMFSERVKTLEKSENNKSIIELDNNIRYLIHDFQNEPNISIYKNMYDSLNKTLSYKKELKRWNEMISKEINITNVYSLVIENLKSNFVFPDSTINWWKKEILELKRKEKSHNYYDSYLASRLLFSIDKKLQETSDFFRQKKLFEESTNCLELCIIANEFSIFTYYKLACLYAITTKETRLYKTLERMVNMATDIKSKLKYNPTPSQLMDYDALTYICQRIKNDQAFKELRNDSRFQSIISQL